MRARRGLGPGLVLLCALAAFGGSAPARTPSTFAYDAGGRLISDANAKDAATTLAPSEADGAHSVALTDSIGGTATSSVERLDSGTRKRVATDSGTWRIPSPIPNPIRLPGR